MIRPPVLFRAQQCRRRFLRQSVQQIVEPPLSAFGVAPPLGCVRVLHGPIHVAPAAVIGLQHAASRNDVFGTHEEVVVAARTQRLAYRHWVGCEVWTARDARRRWNYVRRIVPRQVSNVPTVQRERNCRGVLRAPCVRKRTDRRFEATTLARFVMSQIAMGEPPDPASLVTRLKALCQQLEALRKQAEALCDGATRAIDTARLSGQHERRRKARKVKRERRQRRRDSAGLATT